MARRREIFLSWFFFVLFVSFVVDPSVASAQERIAEILVHGNHTTPEEDILRIAGLTVGEDAGAARLAAAERALRDSGRFAGAEIRRRYRSLTDTSDVLIVILVDEHAAVSEDALIPGPMRRLRAASMWMPIVAYTEGVGVTYGARAGFVEPLGRGSRVTVPLTWGGERRAGVEVELPAKVGLPNLFTLRGGAAIWRRENPHFREHETRHEITAAVMRRVTPWLEAGAIGRASHVSFLAEDAWHRAFGAEVVLDTRQDPSFPRNAVHVIGRWDRIDFAAGATGRASVDARTYVGVAGSAVLALRGALARAGSALPASEQLLVGGGSTLRGYRAGHRIGDGQALVSAELRVPLTSPLSIGRFGVKTFVDAGTPWQAGARLADQRFDRGIGGGVYFGAAAFATTVDVAWPEDGKPRVHVSVGLTF